MWAVCALVALTAARTAAEAEAVTTAATAAATEVDTDGRYTFYRDMEASGGGGGGDGSTRRIFGGAAAELDSFPWVVALLDRYWAARCSGAAVAPQWALTAAHCVTPRLAYVKYNTRRPASPEGDFTPVHFLYRHPEFEVVQTVGADADVTLLHHDVGLVRTRDVMRLRAPPPAALGVALRRYNPQDLIDQEVEVLGFGRTERSVVGEELLGARLALVRCARAAWLHCVCGAAGGAARGVCSGDSGGPVIYNNTQVGVTSMGPAECTRARRAPPAGATSVFTSLFEYAALLEATLADTEAALRMQRINHAAPTHNKPLKLLLLTLTLVV